MSSVFKQLLVFVKNYMAGGKRHGGAGGHHHGAAHHGGGHHGRHGGGEFHIYHPTITNTGGRQSGHHGGGHGGGRRHALAKGLKVDILPEYHSCWSLIDAREEGGGHLFDFSPLFVFNRIAKVPEDAKSHTLHLFDFFK